MKVKKKVRALLAFALLLLAGMPAVADDLVQRASELRNRPAGFMNKSVSVEGFVTQFVDAEGNKAAFFYLKDDWGGILRIQTKDAPPSVGRRYRVHGRLTIDTALQDPFLVEESRAEVLVPDANSANPPKEASSAPPSAGRSMPLVPLGFAAVALVGLGIFLTAGRRAAAAGGNLPERKAAAAPAPASVASLPDMVGDRIVEGKTVRLHLPPPHTVKILPGFFEVLSDEGVGPVLFYKTRSQQGGTITFGRSPGEPYSHIQLKPMTVSARQAQLTFDPQGALLTNLASAESNPTRVNGRELGQGDVQRLADGDAIAMGEVQFRYRAR